MRQIETSYRAVRASAGTGARFASSRETPRTEFLSQLIAERHNLSAQRKKRRAPVADVLSTYDAGGKISIRRMPPGYRLDIDA